MSKSEFKSYRDGNETILDYFINVMAEKRLAGDSFNDHESNVLTWPGVADKIAKAEGERREDVGDGTAPVENTGDNEAEIVNELNRVARGTEDVVYNNKTGDYEYRQDPKKK